LIEQLGYGSYLASIGSVASSKRQTPPAKMIVSAFPESAQRIEAYREFGTDLLPLARARTPTGHAALDAGH